MGLRRTKPKHVRYSWIFILITAIALTVFIISCDSYHVVDDEKLNNMNGYEKYEGYGLHFIHIPKTAGSSIEESALAQNIKYGKYALRKDQKQYIAQRWINKKIAPKCIRKCVPYHIPPRHFMPDYSYYDKSKYKLFCIVRNPFSRILSEYIYLYKYSKQFKQIPIEEFCSIRVFNENLENLIGDFEHNQCHLNCHGLPQYDFVYDINGDLVCDHVLRFEHLEEEFTALMELYGLVIPLIHYNQREHCNGKNGEHELKMADISASNRQLIIDLYSKDFLHFNYSTVQLSD